MYLYRVVHDKSQINSGLILILRRVMWGGGGGGGVGLRMIAFV